MRRRAVRAGVLFALGGLLVAVTREALPCSPSFTPVYSFTQLPGPSREEFLGGRLGIVSGEWDSTTLLVAFRYLEGPPMDARARAAFADLWPAPRVGFPPDAVGLWRAAVQRAGGTPPAWIYREREQPGPRGLTYGYYLNCLDDAFEVAARTLDDRVERYGRGSRETQAWLAGQTIVFENCAGGEREPPELEPSWDARLRADRAYQRAAAALYGARHALAEERFAAIAADRASEWSRVAAYLVARAQIRGGKLAAAEATLRAVLADPGLERWHGSARGLLDYVAARSRPAEREAELAARVLGPRVSSPIVQDLTDYLWLVRWTRRSDYPLSQDFRDWAASLSAVADREKDAVVARYLERPSSLSRLVAALRFRVADAAAGERILRAAEAVPASSPGYLSISYLRAQRLAEIARETEARRVLDGLLAAPPAPLAPSDRNALRRLRATLADSLEEFVALMLMPRVGDAVDGREGPLLDYPPREPGDELPPEALYVLSHGVALDDWSRLVTADFVPKRWRRVLALSGFVRSVVHEREDLLAPFARQAAALEPSLAPDLEGVLGAEDADRRSFSGVLTLLRHPGLTYEPHLRPGPLGEIHSFRDNWWCGGPEMTVTPLTYRPRFLGHGPPLAPQVPAQPAAVFLGERVLAYRERHPDDPRLPEALHRVVRVTRFGCGLGDNGRISRAAFEELHRRHSTSEWARRTPYWFK